MAVVTKKAVSVSNYGVLEVSHDGSVALQSGLSITQGYTSWNIPF